MKATATSIDVITDYMVLFKGKLVLVSHHTMPRGQRLAPNASDWAINSGSDYLVTADPSKWIGQKVECSFFRSGTKHLLTVFAKSARHWDHSLPMGQRKVSEKKSAKWNEYYKKYFKR